MFHRFNKKEGAISTSIPSSASASASQPNKLVILDGKLTVCLVSFTNGHFSLRVERGPKCYIGYQTIIKTSFHEILKAGTQELKDLLKDPTCIVEAIKKLIRIKQTSPIIKCNLGILYRYGKGVSKAPKKAYAWFSQAAAQGYAVAQFQLGLCYTEGVGVNENREKAVTCFSQAAAQGLADAQFQLGKFRLHGYVVPKDLSKAFELFNQAAAQKHVDASGMLGLCYFHGEGVLKDLNKAVAWFSQAAEQGLAAAQYDLGYCYWAGSGVPKKDLSKTFELFSQAAAQGHENAQ